MTRSFQHDEKLQALASIKNQITIYLSAYEALQVDFVNQVTNRQMLTSFNILYFAIHYIIYIIHY